MPAASSFSRFPRVAVLPRQQRDGGAGELHLRALLDRLEVVLLQHVRDLVRQHAGELGLASHALEQAAGDEDVAARHGEGVELRRLQHAEAPRQVRPLGLRGEPAADVVDVALHALVRHQRRGAEQPRRDVLADLDLFLFVDLLRRLADVLGGVEQPVDVELRLRGQGRAQRAQREYRQPVHLPSSRG